MWSVSLLRCLIIDLMVQIPVPAARNMKCLLATSPSGKCIVPLEMESEMDCPMMLSHIL